MSEFLTGLHNGLISGLRNYMFGSLWGSIGYNGLFTNGIFSNPYTFNSMSLYFVPSMNYNIFSSPDTGWFSCIQPPSFDLNIQLPSFDYNNFTIPNNYTTASLPFISQTNYSSFWNNSYFNNTENSVNASQKTVKKEDKPKTVPTRTANELYSKWSKKSISKDAELTPEFCEKVIQISKNIKCDPEDLMALMYHESRFSPKAKNEKNKGKNVGLIQFGAATRKSFGLGDDSEVSFNKMLNMRAIEQLDYVEKYFVKSRKNSGFAENEILTTDDIAAMAFGSSIGKKEVLAVEGSLAYRNNIDLDTNKDNKITKNELGNRLRGIKA